MRRLFYLVSSIDSAADISRDLNEHGVKDWRFHVVSKDEVGLYQHRLHTANIRDRTDLVRYVERGILIGAAVALLFVVPLALFADLGVPFSAWVALAIFLMVAGGWLAGFGGIQGENYRIQAFHDDIEAGKHLIMVDAPKKHVDKVKELMKKNHPEAKLQGEDTSFNNPFAKPRNKPRSA